MTNKEFAKFIEFAKKVEKLVYEVTVYMTDFSQEVEPDEWQIYEIEYFKDEDTKEIKSIGFYCFNSAYMGIGKDDDMSFSKFKSLFRAEKVETIKTAIEI